MVGSIGLSQRLQNVQMKDKVLFLNHKLDLNEKV